MGRRRAHARLMRPSRFSTLGPAAPTEVFASTCSTSLPKNCGSTSVSLFSRTTCSAPRASDARILAVEDATGKGGGQSQRSASQQALTEAGNAVAAKLDRAVAGIITNL